MKALNSKTVFLALTLSVATFSGAMAQEVIVNNNAAPEKVVHSEQIDINGYVDEPMATDHELETVKHELNKQKQTIVINKEKSKKYKELSKTTEKLADVTEELIDDRKESKGEIDQYNKKIECLMQENPGRDCDKFVKRKNIVQDEVSTEVAAVAKSEVEVSETSQDSVKIMALAGLSTFNGAREQLESEMALGIRVESQNTGRFAFGVGARYTSFTTDDFGGNNYYASGFMPYYDNFYGPRKISYSNFGLDVYSKFYLTKEGSVFKPYLGLGIGFNRSTLNYNDNRNLSGNVYGFSNYNFGDERVTRTNMSGTAMAGAEVKLGKSFGLNFEMNYARSFNASFGNSNAMNAFNSPDQMRLQDLADELLNANSFSFMAGASYSF